MTLSLSRPLFLLAISAGAAAAAPNLKPLDPDALHGVVEALGREFMLPGAMVLLKTPDGAFAYGYGATERGGSVAPTAGTHFRIASNTKTMTAAVVVLLAGEGRLDLGDPVSAHVDGVPNGETITISDLLKMRSGLPNFTGAPELARSLDGDPSRVWTPEELLAMAFAQPPLFAPGTEFDYCNTNYLLLGLVIEKLEGKPLAEVFQERLFAPLGMTDTLLPAADSTAIPTPFARGYMYGGAEYALVDTPYPAELQAAARAGTLAPTDDTDQNPSYARGAGGVISTAADLATWMEALVGGGVFDADWQQRWFDSLQAQDPAAPDGQKYGYGITEIAWGPNRIYFHGGEMPGYNSFMGHDPVNDVTLVVWSTLTLSLDGQHTANSIMVKLLGEIYAVAP